MKVTVEITPEQIACLLVSAFEGGSNYWYEITKQKRPTKFDLYCGKPEDKADFRGTDGKPQIFPHVDFPMNPGGSLTISSTEATTEDGPGPRVLSLTTIQRGLQDMAKSADYAHHFADIIRDDTDATTGDVFLQFCLYGEVLYG